MSILTSFIWFGLIFVLTAAYCDFRTRKIPNLLNFSVLGIALLARLALSIYQNNLSVLTDGLWGFLIGLGIFLPFFIFRLGVGAGDIKLLAALGAILGWKAFLWVFCLTTLWDGLLIVFLWVKRMYVFLALPLPIHQKLIALQDYVRSEKRSSKNPYGLPVALGYLSFLLACYLAKVPLRMY